VLLCYRLRDGASLSEQITISSLSSEDTGTFIVNQFICWMEHFKVLQLLIRHFHDIFWLFSLEHFCENVCTADILPKSGGQVEIFIPFLSEGKLTSDFGLS
jgi:hypothetical protein